MKLNRLLSAAVAACMSLTMFAGAVSLDAAANEAESETLTGSAFLVTADGTVKSTFEYTVPEDATEEEADLIILQAAEEAAGVARSRAFSHRDSILTARNVSIPGKVTADTALRSDGGMIEFLVNGLSCSGELGVAFDRKAKVSDIVSGEAGVFFYQDDTYCRIKADTYPVFTLYTYEASTATRIRAYHNY